MKIINLSLANFPDEKVPVAWVKKSFFFKGIWEAIAKWDQVIFIEFIQYEGNVKIEQVEYWFRIKTRNQLKFPFSIFRTIRKEAPDIVIVHGLHFPWQVLLLRFFVGNHTRIIAQHHGEQPFRHFPKRWLQKLADKYIDAYFFTTNAQAQVWQHIARNEKKIKEVMEVSSIFYPIAGSTACSVTKIKERRTYIWVGHLDDHKDPLTAIRAFVQFILSGNEGYLYMIFQSEALLPAISAYLEQYPIAREAIQLVGKVEHDDLFYWYNSADFVIATSHREAGGVSVCEAMSCGCIPILSNIPSFTAMKGQCGFSFEKGNAQSLYEALIKTHLINIEAEKERVLQQFNQKLSFEAIANDIRKILQQL